MKDAMKATMRKEMAAMMREMADEMDGQERGPQHEGKTAMTGRMRK